MEQNLFDKHAISYDKELQDSLKIASVDASYFSEYKVKKSYNYCIKHQIDSKRILDFGCGIGNSCEFLSQYFTQSEIYGVDISRESIAAAQKRELINCHFDHYDGSEFHYHKEFFDIIFVSNVFHHIEHSKHKYILKQLKKILAPKGKIFFFEHNTLNPVTRKIVNDCAFDKDAVLLNYWYTKRSFESLGFNSKVSFILFIPPKYSYLLFLEKYLEWLPMGGQYMVVSSK